MKVAWYRKGRLVFEAVGKMKGKNFHGTMIGNFSGQVCFMKSPEFIKTIGPDQTGVVILENN